MAYRVGAGEAFRSIEPTRPPPNRGHPRYVLYHDDYSEYDSDDTSPHPRPLPAWDVPGQRHDRARGWHGGEKPEEREWSPEPEHHQFFIIREGTPSPVPTAAPSPGRDVIRLQPNHHHHFHPSQQQQHHHRRHHHDRQQHANNNTHEPAPAAPVACSMERTASGRTILTEATTANQQQLECADFSPKEDRLAALQVRRHMAKPRQNAKRHERILRALIHPKPHAAKGTEFPLDNDALESIFSAADEIFFQGRLARRVHWEWSSFESSSSSSTTGGGGGGGIIGTTALRRASPPARGGYETLIVLSSPILTDTGYNRRLLIATFLHELVHSYLFICCGFKARHCGGHTAGFRAIAAAIDEWAGRGTLRLCDMEADLAHFREAGRGESSPPPPAAAPAHGESSGRGQGQVNHAPRHEQQQHYQHQAYRYEQQQATPEKRYHHHGGVESYDLNESPWSTGPRVVFGSGGSSNDDSGRRHHYHDQQQGIPAASHFTTLDSFPASCSPSSTTTPQGAGCAWSYHQTRFSSPPTPPPSMSTTPLSSVTTLVGREEEDDDQMVVVYDEYCYEHHEGGQQQQHVFTPGSDTGMRYF